MPPRPKALDEPWAARSISGVTASTTSKSGGAGAPGCRRPRRRGRRRRSGSRAGRPPPGSRTVAERLSLSPKRISSVATVSFSFTMGTTPSSKQRRCSVWRAFRKRSRSSSPARVTSTCATLPPVRREVLAVELDQPDLARRRRRPASRGSSGPGSFQPSSRLPTAMAPDETSTTSRPRSQSSDDLARDVAEDALAQLAVLGERRCCPTFTTMRRARATASRALLDAAHVRALPLRALAGVRGVERPQHGAQQRVDAFAGGSRDAAAPRVRGAQLELQRGVEDAAIGDQVDLVERDDLGALEQRGLVGGRARGGSPRSPRADRALRAARRRRRAGARARASARCVAGSGRRGRPRRSRPRSGRGCRPTTKRRSSTSATPSDGISVVNGIGRDPRPRGGDAARAASTCRRSGKPTRPTSASSLSERRRRRTSPGLRRARRSPASGASGWRSARCRGRRGRRVPTTTRVAVARRGRPAARSSPSASHVVDERAHGHADLHAVAPVAARAVRALPVAGRTRRGTRAECAGRAASSRLRSATSTTSPPRPPSPPSGPPSGTNFSRRKLDAAVAAVARGDGDRHLVDERFAGLHGSWPRAEARRGPSRAGCPMARTSSAAG